MRVDLQPTYVLHTRAYRDTSLLVDCFTQDYGRLTLVAKGVRKSKQGQRQLLQPFSPLLISWQGKSQLKTLVGCESAAEPFTLSSYYLYSGLYINELLSYVLADNDTATEIYTLYHALLHDLQSQQDLEPSLRQFEFSLLTFLGYGIDFRFDAMNAETIIADQEYALVNELGFVHRDNLEHGDHVFYLGEDILAIADRCYEKTDTRKAAKQISRLAFNPLLQGKTIKSRELFAGYK